MFSLPIRRIISLLRVLIPVAFVCFVLLSRRAFQEDLDIHYRFPPQVIPPYVCPLSNETRPDVSVRRRKLGVTARTDSKVLVFVETLYSKLGKQISSILDSLKVPYKVETLGKNLPLLTTAKHGRFAAIIIENYYKYLTLPSWNRQLLDKYCRDYGSGIISFLGNRPHDFLRVKIRGSQLKVYRQQRVSRLRFNQFSKVLYIAKAGAVLETPEPDRNDWVLFDIGKGYKSIITAYNDKGERLAAVILDEGLEDGIERILFGHNFSHWINKLAFVDALRYIGENLTQTGLERYIQIDIDDIFVGTSGSRMTRADVMAMLESQNRLRRMITGFTYSLGFSGYYFRNGDQLEDEGDESLIENGKHFIWFPHMWKHNHAHEHNQTYLEAIMTQNKLFAQAMGLSVTSGYAISPQHAGVYPVHEALYNAWQLVWDITVTSTEEYPHFRPASSRRGFIHKNISVLPRQTCGLYTHTQFFHSYPDGFSKLLRNIEGGDLFFTIVMNPFSVFMTHQQNYANDRLGIFTFERVVDFIKCWTNLRLHWMEPRLTAKAYFTHFKGEKRPIWSNPCTDPRHERILPLSFNCSEMSLPNLLIVGPQKTGSTALGTFLTLHPNISTNNLIPSSFEELQFFGGSNYARGIHWYMDQFRGKSDHSLLFEKSATYFDNPDAPRAAAALLPKADVVVILIDPSVRAYSWYQHMRAHNDSAAMSFTFGEMLYANATEIPLLRRLKSRCLSPGRYAHHLERWLDFYPLSQFHIIDGDSLRENPVRIVAELVVKLGVAAFNFDNFIKFDDRKGFFCAVVNETKRCLGTGKGRKYEPMGVSVRGKLDQIFREDNIALHKLLFRHNLPIPRWLRRHLSQSDYDI